MTIARTNKLFDAASMAASLTSDTVDLQGCSGAAIHLASPVGTRAGEIHIDMANVDSSSDDDWVTVYTLPVSTLTLVNHLQDITKDMNAQYLRVRWARTSGIGALTAIVHLNRK